MENAIIKEEYIIAIKNRYTAKYIFTAHPCKADTFEKCMTQYARYRENWEHCSKALDFNNYKIYHRTVITTKWEEVNAHKPNLMPMPGTTDPNWGKKHWEQN